MINLLPPPEKEKIYGELFKKQLYAFGFTAAVVLFGGAILILNTLAFLKIQTRELNNFLTEEAESSDNQSVEIIESGVKGLNSQLAQYKKFRDETISSTLIFSKIEEIVPAGAGLTSVLINIAESKVVVSGEAARREDVVRMENNLKKSVFFERVDSPLTNFLDKTNSRFSFTFYLKK